MTEVIAVGASVIAIVQISDRIIGLCKSYIETVRDASSDLRSILLEISTLKTVFETLSFLNASGSGVSSIVAALSGGEGPVEGCRRSIMALEKLLSPKGVQVSGENSSKRRKVQSTLAALAWPLKETKAKKLLDEIMRYKTTVTLALTADSIHDIKYIKTKAVEMHELLTDGQRQEIFKWLQHTDPSPIHHQAQRNYEPGTGNWMLRSTEWADWLDVNYRCLWIHGIPGAGKTVLMSYLIDQIKEHCNNQQKGTVAYVYYYCYFAREQDDAVPFLRWLINQLCRQADWIPDSVCKMFKHGGEPSLADLLRALAETVEKFDSVFVAVDAIDESRPREDTLKVFRDLVADPRFENVQLMASSREYIDIERIMVDFSVSISMNNLWVEEDIRLHVHSTLHSNPTFRRWPQELLTEAEDAIATGAKEMFRWAVCQIDALRRLNCEREVVKKALKNLLKTLDETYDRIFGIIPEEERLFVHHALQWIHFHNEIYEGKAIPCGVLLQGVAKSTAALIDGSDERFYDQDILQELCGCLISISPAKDCSGLHEDRPTLMVSLAHYTVREYLDSTRNLKAEASYFTAYKGELKHNCTDVVLSEILDLK